MKGLVLIRAPGVVAGEDGCLVVLDDVEVAAKDLDEEAVDRGEQCPINVIVLCELVRVLREAYHLDKPTVAATLETVLDTAQLVVEQADLARRALDDYRRGRGDFADYLTGWRNRQAGCSDTATFDRALGRSALFRVP